MLYVWDGSARPEGSVLPADHAPANVADETAPAVRHDLPAPVDVAVHRFSPLVGESEPPSRADADETRRPGISLVEPPSLQHSGHPLDTPGPARRWELPEHGLGFHPPSRCEHHNQREQGVAQHDRLLSTGLSIGAAGVDRANRHPGGQETVMLIGADDASRAEL